MFDKNIQLPVIDKEFISDVFKVLTIRKSNRGGYTEETMPPRLKELIGFYKTNYALTISNYETIYYDKLSYILAYEAIDMITNINNNIQEHFIDHLNKYVNIVFSIKEKSTQITIENKDKIIRKQLHKQLYDEIGKVKKDLMHFGDLTSDEKYHQWIIQERIKLYPNKTRFDNDNIYYHLKNNTQDFLISMFHILIELEKLNEIRMQNEDKQIRLFNILPLRTNIVGKNICIDTCGLISNFLGTESTSNHLKDYKKDNNQVNLWNKFFKLNKRVFKKGQKYTFSHIIRTDGISCCVLFVRVDANGKPLPKTWKNKKCHEEDNIDYIERTIITEELKNMKVVCADPNYSDLIYCGSIDENENLQTFRYTQDQRRVETRSKKYNKIRDNLSKQTMIEKKSIKEIESALSNHNSKTCSYNKFMEYCIEKNNMNSLLYNYYEQQLFRKLKLNRFTNTQKSELKMVKNFSNKFGKPDNTIFVMGDYDKGNYNMKGKEPVICKKFRRIFRNAGYKTFLVNEFRTSKLCNSCNEELKHFLERPSQKPKLKKENKTEICHGLLRCQSIKHKCEIIHNRDKNAVQNMLNIVSSVLNTGKRPEAFCRPRNS